MLLRGLQHTVAFSVRRCEMQVSAIQQGFAKDAGEREIYFNSHVSLWGHSSRLRLIGRGIPSVLFLN